MPFPTWVARLNRRFTNRLVRSVAGRVPFWAIVRHPGRRTGRVHRTPVTLFRRDGSYVIALTYGRDRDWVKNVLAAGGCEVETRGRIVRLTDPRIITDEERSLVPPLIRLFLRLLRVTEFMELRAG